MTFIESEFPAWPISFHFVLVEASNGATDYFNVGVEVGKRPDVARGERTQLEGIWRRRIDPAVLRHVADNYASFERRARSRVEFRDEPDEAGAVTSLHKEPRRRREMTPERLKMLAEEFDGYRAADCSPLRELARDYGVNPSTVSRWINKAREGGYLPPLDRPGKKGGDDAR